ncbi:flagellar hook-length control protein FliK [Tateyamaria omphalii]|uniref:flagellar hook-length control protein FliK n=1 Tax=Tateyamaria omphalii TaxID=299262 RepID=UPI001677DDF0|nr:flagellar hook-length control protein FliK [Tateyamaria omphalii]
MQLIQTLSTSPTADPMPTSQSASKHTADSPFELAMRENPGEATERDDRDTDAQAEAENVLDSGSPDSYAEHESGAKSDKNSLAEQTGRGAVAYNTDASETHGDATQVSNKTTSGPSEGHANVASGDQSHTPSAQRKPASPMSAMIQGLSQNDPTSGATLDRRTIENAENAKSILGISAVSESNGARHSSIKNDSLLDLTSTTSTIPSGSVREAGQPSLQGHSTSQNTPNTSLELKSHHIRPSDSTETMQAHGAKTTSKQSELLHAAQPASPSSGLLVTEKTKTATRHAANETTGDSSDLATTSGKKTLAPIGRPETLDQTLVATVRTVNPNSVPQNNSKNVQPAVTIGTLIQDQSQQPSTTIETSNHNDEVFWETRLPSTGQTAKAASALQRVELPQHVSQSVAEAFKKSPDKPIEIALNPAELGRVRMIMSTSETGITVTIGADRGDTLDLMRRNIDDLGKSLSDLGFEDVSFAFDQRRQHAEPSEQSNDADPIAVDETAAPQQTLTPLARTSSLASTGIDMRL